jgi:hypothetical protein
MRTSAISWGDLDGVGYAAIERIPTTFDLLIGLTPVRIASTAFFWRRARPSSVRRQIFMNSAAGEPKILWATDLGRMERVS